MDIVECPLCSSTFTTVKNFSQHLKILHRGSLKFVCKKQNCMRTFSNRCVFISHIESHFCEKIPDSENITKNDQKLTTENRHLVEPKISDNETENMNLEEPKISDNNSQLDLEIILECNRKQVEKVNEPKDTNLNSQTEEGFEIKVAHETDIFMSNLYAQTSLPLNMILFLVTIFQNFFNTNFIEKIESINKILNCTDLCMVVNLMKNTFCNYSTYHKAIKSFKSLFYVEPQTISVANILRTKRIQKRKKYTSVKISVVSVPLKEVLKNFLELPHIYTSIVNYINEKEKCKCLCSIFQSERWKDIKSRFAGKFVLPLTLFGDDFEINNPIGSHKGRNKLHSIYCTISAIPPEFTSQLQNILLVQLCKSELKKVVNHFKLFNPVVQQLLDLQKNGIVISVNSKNVKIHFDIFNLSGDNLELHTLLGFHESFNSIYPCRMCYMDKEKCKTAIIENEKLLRCTEKHSLDIEKKIHGVKSESIFSRIPGFDLFKYVSFDPMHDLLEGLCRYELADVLHQLIYVDKLFTSRLLQKRLENYCNSNASNETPSLNIDHISKKKCLIMSASEMKFLLFNLTFLIGDLVPSKNKAWKLYLSLRKVVFLIFAPVLTEKSILELQQEIKNHHILYLKIFKKSLRPKHHHLLHYIRNIRLLGLPRRFSCMRFEGKHRTLKDIAKATTSRINSPKTLAVKHQLQLNYRFLVNRGFQKVIDWGKQLFTNTVFLDKFNLFEANLCDEIKLNYIPVTWITVNGIRYNENSVLVTSVQENSLELGKVVYILVQPKSKDVVFLCQNLKIVTYSFHLCSYEVEETNDYICMNEKKLFVNGIYNIIKMSDQKMYVSYDL